MDAIEAGKVQTLNQFGFGLDNSILLQVLRSNGGDIDKATDELLTMAARLDRTQITAPQAAVQRSDEEAQNMRAFSIESKNAAENHQKGSSSAQKVENKTSSTEPRAASKESKLPAVAIVAPPVLMAEKEPESIYRSAASSLSEITDLPPMTETNADSPQDPSARNFGSELRHQSAAVVAPQEPVSIDDDLDLKVPEPATDQKRENDLFPGRFFIYKRQDLTKKAIDDIVGIKSFLAAQSLNDFSEVDLTHDHELAGFIKAKCGGKLNLPVVFLKTQLIGSFEDLKEALKSGKLQQLIDEDKKFSGGAGMECAPELQLNVLDKCLNAAETVLSWLNPVSWLWRTKPQEAPKDVVDFEVVQSNWYWRHQRRKLRFAQDFFLRIHPTYMDIRAAHKIDAIASITVTDAYNFIIRYKDGSSPDFIRCRHEDLPRIVSIVQTRSKAVGPETSVIVAPGVTIETASKYNLAKNFQKVSSPFGSVSPTLVTKMEAVELSFFDIPWDVRFSSIFNQLDCADFAKLAAVSKGMKANAYEDCLWERLLDRMKKAPVWDRWLNELTTRTLNFHPRLLYAVLKVILTHKSTGMSYVKSSTGNTSVLIRNVLVDFLVYLEDIYALPAHLSLLFTLFTYMRHGSSIKVNPKAGFTHGKVKIRHSKVHSWLAKHFQTSGNLTKGETWRMNRYIRTFCEPFATLTFSFAIQWRQKPLLARKTDRLRREEFGITDIEQYWLFDFASASPLCPAHVKAALEEYRMKRKPPHRPWGLERYPKHVRSGSQSEQDSGR